MRAKGGYQTLVSHQEAPSRNPEDQEQLMNHMTSAAIAEQRRNEMMSAASRRQLARTVRAAHRSERPTGWFRNLLAVFFTGTASTKAPVPTATPAPATAAVEPTPADPATSTNLPTAA